MLNELLREVKARQNLKSTEFEKEKWNLCPADRGEYNGAIEELEWFEQELERIIGEILEKHAYAIELAESADIKISLVSEGYAKAYMDILGSPDTTETKGDEKI